jgi:predicted nucleic-acid-binding protein
MSAVWPPLEWGEFADAMIAGLRTKANCSCTLTFDEKVLRLAGFEIP